LTEQRSQAPRRAITYCIVPEELADRLHELLRAHFADQAVEVVVEQRWRGRRRAGERRQEDAAGRRELTEERRRIRGEGGRRVADRRATAISVEPLLLPRKARAHADRLAFVEVLEPSEQQLEDRDTGRLVACIQAGAHEEFSELYRRYFDRVYSYLLVMLSDAHRAEDATQQVFLRVLETLPHYERRSQPFRAWLFVLVRNHAIDHLRQMHRMAPVEREELDRRSEEAGKDAEPELPVLDWISDRELTMFIERLPLSQRQVLVLRYMLDLSTDEIAVALSRSPTDVRKLNERALAFLRQRLTAVGREPRESVARSPWLRRGTQLRVIRSRRWALH
jgi:RNA polymerase sigma-70 factor (ECF subfamily)